MPSRVTRISSPTVSTTSVYHLPASSLAGIGDAATDEELGDFGLLRGIFLHFIDIVAHAAVAFVDEGDAVEADLGAADVAVVGAGVLAVVELDVDHRGAFKADPDLDDAVLGGDFQAMHGGVGL